MEGREKKRGTPSPPEPRTARTVVNPARTAHHPVRTTAVKPPPTAAVQPAKEAALTLEKKKEIYARAAQRRALIASRQEALDRRRREGKKTEVHASQLERVTGMYEKHLEFSCEFNRISRSELDALIREGDRLGWPTE